MIGFVIDAETGKPPQGVVIVGIKGGKAEDTRPEKTGELRMYELVVDPGVWRIEARAQGYQTATVENVRVLPGHGPGKGTWLGHLASESCCK